MGYNYKGFPLVVKKIRFDNDGHFQDSSFEGKIGRLAVVQKRREDDSLGEKYLAVLIGCVPNKLFYHVSHSAGELIIRNKGASTLFYLFDLQQTWLSHECCFTMIRDSGHLKSAIGIDDSSLW